MKSVITLIFSLILFTSCNTTETKISEKVIQEIDIPKLEALLNADTDTTYIINFWATWCAPCLKEIPYFDQLGETYKKDKMKVLLVSVDLGSAYESGSVHDAMTKRNFQSQVLYITESDAGKYIDLVSPEWSGAIPATIVINNKKGIKNFYEQEFNFQELEQVYLTTKK